jgi:hypothetical protein
MNKSNLTPPHLLLKYPHQARREVWDHKTSLIVPLLIELQLPSHEICFRGITFASVSKVYFYWIFELL